MDPIYLSWQNTIKGTPKESPKTTKLQKVQAQLIQFHSLTLSVFLLPLRRDFFSFNKRYT